MSADDALSGRLRWRCRRGAKELDLLFDRFLDHGYESLDPAQRRRFDALLDQPDPQLLAWFSGDGEPADPRMKAIVRRILGSADPA